MKSLNFSPDGRQIVAASAEKENIVVWDVETSTVLKVIDETVTSPAAFSDCGKILATPSTGKITLRDTETWEEIDFVRLASPVTCIDFYRYRSTTRAGDPDLIIGCEDGTVAVWDVKGRSQRCKSRLHKKRVNFVGFLSDSDYTSQDAEMVSVGEDRKLIKFSINDDSKPYFRITRKSKVPAASFINTVKWHFIFADVYGYTEFRSLYRRRALGKWSFFRGTYRANFRGVSPGVSLGNVKELTALYTFSTSYNDNLLIGYADGAIRFAPIRLKLHPIFRYVKAEIGDTTGIDCAHTDSVTALSYSSKSGILASGSADGIKLWDITKLRDLKLGDPKLEPIGELRL